MKTIVSEIELLRNIASLADKYLITKNIIDENNLKKEIKAYEMVLQKRVEVNGKERSKNQKCQEKGCSGNCKSGG